MKKRILIAEDEIESREMLVKLFSIRGYDVDSASNGTDLLTLASEKKFDVVITDIKMPGLDGASAIETMRLRGDTTPVIALTGLSKADLGHAQDKFTRILHKPVNLTELFYYIESLLGK